MDSKSCSIRLCRNQTSKQSPITCLPLCDQHLLPELAKIDKTESAVAERIAHFNKYKEPLRLMQQRLASDLQLLDDTFSDLRDSLDRCQKELVDVITKQHDQLLDSLRTLTELEEFEAELRAAKEQNDMRQVFTLNEGMLGSLESLQLDTQLVSMDDETQQVRMAAYPDVNSRVQDIQLCIETQMNVLRFILESLDAKKSQKSIQLKTKETKKDLDVGGKAVSMTMLSNTKGLMIDNRGSIVRAVSSSAEMQTLPQPIVLVVVDADSQSSIKLLSFDSDRQLTLKCSWDSSQPITDLHCDDKRQQLFIAQKQAVTVADLCGEFVSRISVSELEDGAQEIHCITGDCDKLFLCATVRDKGAVLFAVSKESTGVAQVQVRLAAPFLMEGNALNGARMATRNRMIVLSTSSCVFKVCSITGLLVSAEKTQSGYCLGFDMEDKTSPMSIGDGGLFILLLCLNNSKEIYSIFLPLRTPLPPSNASLLVNPRSSLRICEALLLEDGSLCAESFEFVSRAPATEEDIEEAHGN